MAFDIEREPAYVFLLHVTGALLFLLPEAVHILYIIEMAFETLQKPVYFCLIMAGTLLILLSAPCLSSGHVIVDTDQTALLEKGKRGELPCRVQRDIYAVNWFKLTSNQTEVLIIFMDLFANPGEKGGPGYEDGSFDIDANFSLIIKRVEISDEGSYMCEVPDIETGMIFQNSTEVNIFASPEEPYPLIEECIGENATETEQNCTLTASTTNVTCFVDRYYPNINLSFIHEYYRVKSLITFETVNEDGTLNKSIVTNVSASEEPYYCVASEIPGYHGNMTAEVIIQSPPPLPKETNGANLAAIITPSIFLAAYIMTLSVACLIVFLRRKGIEGKTDGTQRSEEYTAKDEEGSDEARNEVNEQILKKLQNEVNDWKRRSGENTEKINDLEIQIGQIKAGQLRVDFETEI